MGWVGYGGPVGGTYYHAQALKLRAKPELNPKNPYNKHMGERDQTNINLFTQGNYHG